MTHQSEVLTTWKKHGIEIGASRKGSERAGGILLRTSGRSELCARVTAVVGDHPSHSVEADIVYGIREK